MIPDGCSPVEVILDKDRLGRGLPGPMIAVLARKSWSFYRKLRKGWAYITVELSDKPVLVAVTDEQYATFKTLDLIAVPGEATWTGTYWNIKDAVRLPKTEEE